MKKLIADKLLEKVKSDYNSIAADFDRTRQHSWKEFDQYLEYIKDGDKIADIGCGNGRLFQFLKKHRKIDYCGVDNSENLLKIASKEAPKGQFKIGELYKTNLPDKQYNATFCIAALHHLPTVELRKKCLKELKRITKKQGTIIISAWNLFQPKYKKYIWKARLKSISTLGLYHPRDTFIPWANTGINRYYYAFKKNEFLKLLQESGLIIEKFFFHHNLVAICKKSQS